MSTWSSDARLAALSPPPTVTTNFQATLPLSSLLSPVRSRPSTVSNSSPSSRSRTLPRVDALPPSVTHQYQAAVEAMHATRAERLQRLPRGWSQPARSRSSASAHVAVYNDELHAELVQHVQQQQVHALQNAQRQANSSRSPSHSPSRSQHVLQVVSSSNSPSSSSSPSSPSHNARSSSVDSLTCTDLSSVNMAHTSLFNARTRRLEKKAMSEAKMREFWSEVQAEQERCNRKLKAKLKRNQERDERQFQQLLDSLSANQDLLQDITAYLSLHSSEQARRKELLYKSWCEQVFLPIQQQINEQVENDEVMHILEEQRRELFEHYLQTSNAQKHRTSQTDVPVAKSSLRYHTYHLHNPLHAQQEAYERENRLHSLFDEKHTVIEPQTKTMLTPTIWGKYKIESTPHGRYSLLKNNEVKKVGRKFYADATGRRDHIVMDHYTMELDQNKSYAQYFPRGKRVEGGQAGEDYNIVSNLPPLTTLPRSIKQFYTPSKNVILGANKQNNTFIASEEKQQ